MHDIATINRPTVLLIDDQWGQSDSSFMKDRYGQLPFRWVLESAEEQTGCYSCEKALARIQKENPVVVLLDVMFGPRQPRLGLEILEAVRKTYPSLGVVMFTGLDSKNDRELVVRCMELGANEYLEKAPGNEHMQKVLSVYTGVASDNAIYGNSEAIRRVRADLARAAFSGKSTILITGDSGTGKELVAKALHRQGPRCNGYFAAHNCANQDSQLIESELYGHVKGAFTGAVSNRIGLFQQVNGGVLFLDELASMPLHVQGRLLRVLETRTFRQLGGEEDIVSDFQLFCAINRPVEELLKEKTLREDFYYRISAFTIHVPPLRDRREDIPILAQLFLQRLKDDTGYSAYRGEYFTDDSLRRMQLYDWPGNVRELRNAVERALILSTNREIDFKSLYSGSAMPISRVCANFGSVSSDDQSGWERERLVLELRLALHVKKRVQSYKGQHWRAEFMRVLYPNVKAASAKGFDDLIKRLTNGPWGCPKWKNDPSLAELIADLER